MEEKKLKHGKKWRLKDSQRLDREVFGLDQTKVFLTESEKSALRLWKISIDRFSRKVVNSGKSKASVFMTMVIEKNNLALYK